jgi:hypothetical protein
MYWEPHRSVTGPALSFLGRHLLYLDALDISSGFKVHPSVSLGVPSSLDCYIIDYRVGGSSSRASSIYVTPNEIEEGVER